MNLISFNRRPRPVTDSGGPVTVTTIGAGLPGHPYQTQIDAHTPTILYASVGASGIYRSTDGGLNFSPRNNGLSGALAAGGQAKYLAMSPQNPNRLFVTLSGLFGKHLYVTNDGGATWTQTSNMDEQNADGWVAGSIFGWTSNISGVMNSSAPLAFHPTNDDVALTSGFGDMVKRTMNGGVTWTYSNSGYTGAMGGQVNSASPIGWDSSNPSRAAFFHADFGTLITADAEDTFVNVASVSYGNSTATHAGALNGNTIVESVGQNGPLAIAVSRDFGRTWALVAGVQESRFDFVAFHPQDSRIVYANNYKFTNIKNSNDFGKLERRVNALFLGNGNIVYSNGGNSIWKSTNGGLAWSNPYPSLGIPPGHSISQIGVDPSDEDRIYATVPKQGVYIITGTVSSGGMVLLRGVANGLANDQFGALNIYTLAVDPNNPHIIYSGARAANVGPSNGISRSTDRGLSWMNVSYNLGPEIDISNISVNPHNSYVYVSTFAGTWKLPPP